MTIKVNSKFMEVYDAFLHNPAPVRVGIAANPL